MKNQLKNTHKWLIGKATQVSNPLIQSFNSKLLIGTIQFDSFCT